MSVLILSLGTTRGLRLSDAQLASMLTDAGATVSVVGVRLGLDGVLRRGYPVNDVVEAYASARALRTAVARRSPRAVIFSSTTAALVASRHFALPYGVWFDAPAALNRPGRRNRGLHRLEATSFKGANVLMPLSPMSVGWDAKTVVIPPPLEPVPARSGPGEPLVVAYTPDPWAKDLALAVRTWAAGDFAGARLVICGIEPAWARAFLARAGLSELPAGVELAGMLSQPEFVALLRQARVFLSTAAWEDFGRAPLEALAAGAALCAAPGGGPFPALELARELDERFVAGSRDPAVVAASLAVALGEGASARYRARASRELLDYGRERIVARLRDQVLGRLL